MDILCTEYNKRLAKTNNNVETWKLLTCWRNSASFKASLKDYPYFKSKYTLTYFENVSAFLLIFTVKNLVSPGEILTVHLMKPFQDKLKDRRASQKQEHLWLKGLGLFTRRKLNAYVSGNYDPS